VAALSQAARFLGLEGQDAVSLEAFWRTAIPAWSRLLAARGEEPEGSRGR
jgi:glutamyl-Q tRNA(Asp) synthetase